MAELNNFNPTMKTKQFTWVGVLTLLNLFGAIQHVSAFYDPGLQRWLNRDPLGDKEFGFMTGKRTALQGKPHERFEGVSLYFAFKNSPIGNIDVLGLGVNCGSGVTSGLVPDRPGGYDFNAPCANHDKCYGTCGASKSDCDSQFLEEMQTVCEESANSSQACMDLANIYYGAVNALGQDPFDQAQKDACGNRKCRHRHSNPGSHHGPTSPIMFL